MAAGKLDIVMELRGCSNTWIPQLERRAEESRKGFCLRDGRVCLSSNRIWQVAMLRATATYFRQTERGSGKEVNCDDSVAIDSPQEGPV